MFLANPDYRQVFFNIMYYLIEKRQVHIQKLTGNTMMVCYHNSTNHSSTKFQLAALIPSSLFHFTMFESCERFCAHYWSVSHMWQTLLRQTLFFLSGSHRCTADDTLDNIKQLICVIQCIYTQLKWTVKIGWNNVVQTQHERQRLICTVCFSI